MLLLTRETAGHIDLGVGQSPGLEGGLCDWRVHQHVSIRHLLRHQAGHFTVIGSWRSGSHLLDLSLSLTRQVYAGPGYLDSSVPRVWRPEHRHHFTE